MNGEPTTWLGVSPKKFSKISKRIFRFFSKNFFLGNFQGILQQGIYCKCNIDTNAPKNILRPLHASCHLLGGVPEPEEVLDVVHLILVLPDPPILFVILLLTVCWMISSEELAVDYLDNLWIASLVQGCSTLFLTAASIASALPWSPKNIWPSRCILRGSLSARCCKLQTWHLDLWAS